MDVNRTTFVRINWTVASDTHIYIGRSSIIIYEQFVIPRIKRKKYLLCLYLLYVWMKKFVKENTKTKSLKCIIIFQLFKINERIIALDNVSH